MHAAGFSRGSLSQPLNAEQLGMLPMPESPVPSHSTPLSRHRHTPSMTSGGPHPPSPLALAPLNPPPDTSIFPMNFKGEGPTQPNWPAQK